MRLFFIIKLVLVWPLRSILKLNFVKNDRKKGAKMGGHMRLYKMPDGMLIGFERDQGGYVMFAKIPVTGKMVYAYMNPEDDYRFELLGATRPPKSTAGREDAIVIKDNRTGAVRTTKAEFLGVATEVGQNRYMMGRAAKGT